MKNNQYKQCEYHFTNLLYVCLIRGCNYQMRLACSNCIKPNEKFYHQHLEENFWAIKHLYYRIDELITLTQYYHFMNMNQLFLYSFEELNHYLQCLHDYKLSNVIQQNYQILLQSIGARLKELNIKDQDIYQIKQFINYSDQSSENIDYYILRVWRKYQLKMAQLSDDNNLLIMGWDKYLSIHSLKDFNSNQYLKFEIPYTYCQFTPKSNNLIMGFQNGWIKKYDIKRSVLSKSLIISSYSKVQVRNIVFVSNYIILINIHQSIDYDKTKLLKFHISNNKLIFKFVRQGEYYLHFDHKKQMIILNNKEYIKIYEEYNRKLVIDFHSYNQLNQIQQIDDSTLISLNPSGNLLIFRVHYNEQFIRQFKLIDINAHFICFNKITQQIIAQTNQSLIIINSQKYQQISFPFLIDNQKIEYAERSIGPMQNSKNFIVTLSKDCVVLFQKK